MWLRGLVQGFISFVCSAVWAAVFVAAVTLVACAGCGVLYLIDGVK